MSTTQTPVLSLSDGTEVKCWVAYAAMGMWVATEDEYDLGHPHGQGTSPEAALEDLRVELESRLPESATP